MRIRTRVAVGVVVICSAFWALPLYRVLSFLQSLPSPVFSINEANDVHFGWTLLFSYSTCVLSSAFLGWLYVRSPRIMVIVPCLMIVAIALRVISLRPEEVIVFFPSIRPFQPAQVGLLAGLIGIYFHRSSDFRVGFDPS
jgi:hypothetical protein